MTDNNQERAQFEAWVKTFNSMPAATFQDDQGQYVDDWIQSRWLGWQARAQLQPASVAVPDSTGRTPLDYAVEHAEYMAVSAESVLADYQSYALARMVADEGGDDGEGEKAEAIEGAEQELVEALVNMRGMIHEFRKRRDRAAAPHPVSGEQKAEFFIDHAVLRAALANCGIAAPESDSELGDRMASYAKQVVRSVSKRPAAQDVSSMLKDPEAVLANMLRGIIAVPSVRSWSKLFGEVLNDEEQRLLEIARLRAEVQGVSGLVEALEKIAKQDIHDDGGEWSAEAARAALAAHRAQQGDHSVAANKMVGGRQQ